MKDPMELISLIRYIETNIETKIDYEQMALSLQMSSSKIRKLFAGHIGVPLKRYISSRKIAHAAFSMINSNKSLMQIASQYGFDVYDTFERAFKRETGKTPSQFRKAPSPVQIEKISVGLYAPCIRNKENLLAQVKAIKQHADCCILFSVPPIGFQTGKCFPFAACMESTLQYMNEKKWDYAYLSAVAGASFRLRWHVSKLDMSSVALEHICAEDPYLPVQRIFKSIGYTHDLSSKRDASKKLWLEKIKTSINKGVPVIVFGIVGPEACLISGYEGEKLMGLSYFQNDLEFREGLSLSKYGYFISDTWWQEATDILIIGGKTDNYLEEIDILQYALKIMKTEKTGDFWAGQKAYEAWINFLSKSGHFAQEMNMALLSEIILCQNDGETMLGEGRYWAAQYLKNVANKYPLLSKPIGEAVRLLLEISDTAQKMTQLRNGMNNDESVFEAILDSSVRNRLIKCLQAAQAKEKLVTQCLDEACQLLR